MTLPTLTETEVSNSSVRVSDQTEAYETALVLGNT